MLSTSQIQFLQAAVLSGDPVADAWKDWQSTGDIENLEPGLFALIPLLVQNLKQHQLAYPERFNGVYKRAWARNSLSLAACNELVSAGLAPLWLGGLQARVAYPEGVLRPLDELECFLLPQQVETAFHLLPALGWRTSQKFLLRSNDAHRPAIYSARFTRSHLQIWLHWHKLPWGASLNQDELPPHRQALYLLWSYAHRPDRILLTLADLYYIVQQPFDWDALLSEARACHLQAWLADQFSLLQSVLRVTLPPEILVELRRPTPPLAMLSRNRSIRIILGYLRRGGLSALWWRALPK